MGNIGMTELILIFLVVLLVFGAKRIPEIARGLGKGMREFKDATSDLKREITLDESHRVNPPYQGTTMPRTATTYTESETYAQPTVYPPVQESQAVPDADPSPEAPASPDTDRPADDPQISSSNERYTD